MFSSWYLIIYNKEWKMKRLLTLIAAAVLMLSAPAAMASVTSTGHDFSGNVLRGMCEVCHVPHAASTGVRLWRASVVIPVEAGTWATAKVGSLCATCHLPGKSMSTVTNTYGASGDDQTDYAFSVNAHQRNIATLTGTIHDAFAAGQTKPYTTGAYIDCTSCHNPHDPTVRPFLRPGAVVNTTISGFCADCHNRYTTAVGTLNTQTWNGAAASMHPVDKAYANDVANGNTTFRATPDAAMTNIITNAHAWSLGGKFQNSAGVAKGVVTVGATDQIGCQTCHAVHGKVGSNPVAGSEQATFLLAIDNASATAALLCEGCHGGPQNTSNVGTGGDHPIDVTLPNGGPAIDRWYGYASASAGQNLRYERHGATVAFWPRAGLIVDSVKTGGKIICTSCHSAHNGRPTMNLTRKGGPIGDGSTGDFCLSCHSDAGPLAHHSNTANWATSAVTCDDCHGTTGSGAHNGFGYTMNGPWNGVSTNTLSNLCVKCHLGVTGGAAGTTAELAKDPIHAVVPVSYLEAQAPSGAIGGAASTYKSHYLGTFADVAANSIQTKKSTWNGVGFSKYGSATETHGLVSDTTGTTMICESCHSLLGNTGRPGNTVGIAATKTSGWENNLLLQRYTDDGAPGTGAAGLSNNGGAAIGSGFCVGCHNQTNVGAPAGEVAGTNVQLKAVTPANMHPMTAWSITKAQDAGRVPTSLITGAGSYADNASRTVVYPAANTMDCDSCHRPHKADANGTWKPAYQAAPVNVILEQAGPAAGKYDTLCANCHAY